MRTIALALLSLTIALHPTSALAPAWTVDSVSLQRGESEDAPSSLAITARNASTGSRTSLTDRVVLTQVDSTFVHDNRLVVLGRAHRVSAVYIFDLRTGKREDWFLCMIPSRIASDWIAYIEWYPNHATADFSDVVLIYDLTRSPIENRFGQEKLDTIPAPDTGAPTRIGIPVYPEFNARTKSYDNVAQSLAAVDSVLLAANPFIMVGDCLVFVAIHGEYPATRSEDIAVIDLSQGPEQSAFREVDIPRQAFPKHGQVWPLINLEALRPDGDDAVRLFVSQANYGVSSVRVDLTGKEVVPAAPPPQSRLEIPPGTRSIRIVEAVQAAKLLSKMPEPSWSGPPARVVFDALIGPEGTVQKLGLVSGPAELVATAERIASSLLYMPTMLNGERIGIRTTISVAFKHQ